MSPVTAPMVFTTIGLICGIGGLGKHYLLQ